MNARVLIVMGVSGAGKTSLGRALAEALDWSFVEGDDLHPAANIAKMRRGEPLSDADRAPWLDRLRAVIVERLDRGTPTVIACSALRQAYRERLRVDPRGVRFVYLRGDEALIRRRLAQRHGHFMPPALLDSQRRALEPPQDAIEVDAAWPITESVAYIRRALESSLDPSSETVDTR